MTHFVMTHMACGMHRVACTGCHDTMFWFMSHDGQYTNGKLNRFGVAFFAFSPIILIHHIQNCM